MRAAFRTLMTLTALPWGFLLCAITILVSRSAYADDRTLYSTGFMQGGNFFSRDIVAKTPEGLCGPVIAAINSNPMQSNATCSYSEASGIIVSYVVTPKFSPPYTANNTLSVYEYTPTCPSEESKSFKGGTYPMAGSWVPSEGVGTVMCFSHCEYQVTGKDTCYDNGDGTGYCNLTGISTGESCVENESMGEPGDTGTPIVEPTPPGGGENGGEDEGGGDTGGGDTGGGDTGGGDTDGGDTGGGDNGGGGGNNDGATTRDIWELGDRLINAVNAVYDDLAKTIVEVRKEQNNNAKVIGEKIDGVGEKVDNVSAKVEESGNKIASKVDGVGDKVEALGGKIDGVGQKVDALGGKVDGVTAQVAAQGNKLGDKIDGLGNKLGDKLDDLKGPGYKAGEGSGDNEAEGAGTAAGGDLATIIDKAVAEAVAEGDEAFQAELDKIDGIVSDWFGSDGSKIEGNNLLRGAIPSPANCSDYTIPFYESYVLTIPVCSLSSVKQILEWLFYVITAIGLWKILTNGLTAAAGRQTPGRK